MSEPFNLEFCGRPCGTGVIEQRDGDWIWAWERPDGSACAGTACSEQTACELLALRVIQHYQGMQ